LLDRAAAVLDEAGVGRQDDLRRRLAELRASLRRQQREEEARERGEGADD
jgi:hypothetical protein